MKNFRSDKLHELSVPAPDQQKFQLLLQCGLQIRVGGIMDIFNCIELRCKNAVGDNLGIAMNKY